MRSRCVIEAAHLRELLRHLIPGQEDFDEVKRMMLRKGREVSHAVKKFDQLLIEYPAPPQIPCNQLCGGLQRLNSVLQQGDLPTSSTRTRGNRSSRRIERACREDVTYKPIAAMRIPDPSTIAEFRRRHEKALGELIG